MPAIRFVRLDQEMGDVPPAAIPQGDFGGEAFWSPGGRKAWRACQHTKLLVLRVEGLAEKRLDGHDFRHPARRQKSPGARSA